MFRKLAALVFVVGLLVGPALEANATVRYVVPYTQVTTPIEGWMTNFCHSFDYQVQWHVGGSAWTGFTVDYQTRWTSGSGYIHKYKLYQWYEGSSPVFGESLYRTYYRWCPASNPW